MTDRMSQLCAEVGVHSQYRGFEGQNVQVSPETQSSVLRVMGLDVRSEADAKSCLEHLQAQTAARPLPLDVVVEAGKPSVLAPDHTAEWVLEAEDTRDALASGSATNRLQLPALPMGIHRLRLKTSQGDFTTWVLARPKRAIQLQDRIPQGRIWGLLAALYGLTDGDAAQIGSYDLLGGYAAALAEHGADFLGINPVHAMGQIRPDDVISPYSPSHRAFLNTWHCRGQGQPTGNKADLLDYPTALRANAQALTDQFAAFDALPEAAPQKQTFEAFLAQAGTSLQSFVLFEALTTKFGADWRRWPDSYRLHNAAALKSFEAEHSAEIIQTKWAQWQAELQLAQAQTRAMSSGMRLGLYLDLAVGPRLGGAETWVKDSALITGATLGAPPDPLGPQGQSWGLAPLSPLTCRIEGYAGFARLLRANMRHAGMIRIDHVLGLMRSFWIPEGSTEGTYVSYPFEALLAVVAIESVRNNTIVVGEDLGLVPEGLRDALAACGIYGLDVLQYMRTPNGGFVKPAKTRAQDICSFATHDTPTIAGFFAAEDARVRHQFGGIDRAMLDQTQVDRARAQETLATSEPVTAIHQHLAKAKASVVAVQLDDVAERTSQQNLPGTVDTYPNWRLKAPFTIKEITESGAFARLSSDMRAQRRANERVMETQDDL